MSVFDKSLVMMLRRIGESWEATIDGECVHFFGCFDAENRLETDATGQQILLTGSVVTMAWTTAKRLTFGQIIKRESDTSEWVIRETIRQDDGQLARVSVVENVI